MIRRTVLTAVAALALAALPSAAMAYDAAGYDTTVADPTPAAGTPTTLSTTGANVGETYTLTVTTDPASISNDAIQIAGTKSLSKTATSATLSWTVTLNAAGTYNVVIVDAAGSTVGTEVLTVAAAAPGAALSDTGFDGMGLAAGAGALLLAGAGAVLIAKRRQTARIPG